MIYYEDERFDEAMALCDEMREGRCRPTSLEGETSSKVLWDDLRVLAYHTFAGGEVWSEWSGLFEALPEDDRSVAGEYVAQLWGCVQHDLEAVHREFCFRVLRANVATLRAAGFEPLPPPASEAQVSAWESRHGIALPEYLRRFFLEVSSGHDEPSETWFFNLMDEDTFVPLSLVEHWDPDEAQTTNDTLAQVLHHLEVTREEGSFAVPKALERMTEGAAIDTATSLVMLYGWFEGNHGDSTDFLITRGPLTGFILGWENMWHSGGGDGGDITFGGCHVSVWLLEVYLQDMLGEELWWP